MTEPIRDPDLDGFLALLAARRAPRTVDAYRRDLEHFAGSTRRPPKQRPSSSRATSRSSAPTGSRRRRSRGGLRRSAPRSTCTPMLLGTRPDNLAAELASPRRIRKLPRTLSPAEAVRLIEAANGTTPRALRDRAIVELLYGAGLRVGELVSLERGSIDLDERLVRALGKGSKERVVPVGRRAVEALRRYLSRGRLTLDTRHRPELFLNAKGGLLTRAGVFLILRRLAGKAGLEPGDPPPPAPLVRDASPRRRRRPQASRRCSVTPTSRRPSSTRARIRFAPPRAVPEPTRTRGGVSKLCRKGRIGMNGISPQVLAPLSTGVGVWMAVAGVQKSALEEATEAHVPIVRPGDHRPQLWPPHLELRQTPLAAPFSDFAEHLRDLRGGLAVRAPARRRPRGPAAGGSCPAAVRRSSGRRSRAAAPPRCCPRSRASAASAAPG